MSALTKNDTGALAMLKTDTTLPFAPIQLRLLAVLAVVLLAGLGLASNAKAEFGFAALGIERANADGTQSTQAGAHPHRFTVAIDYNTHPSPDGTGPTTDGDVRDVIVDLPPGMIGNPLATPRCDEQQMQEPGGSLDCPASTQVGLARLELCCGPAFVPIFNMVPPSGVPAQFGFNIAGAAVHMKARLRQDGSYGVSVDTTGISQATRLTISDATFWGVPAAKSHDGERTVYCIQDFDPANDVCPSDAYPVAFLSNPANCAAGPLITSVLIRSWDQPALEVREDLDQDVNGNSMAVEGCENVPFDPSIAVEPSSSLPDSPTGLAVDLEIPQEGLLNPSGLAPAHLKRATVTLPEGMTLSPSAADGLRACTDAQLAANSGNPMACPESSKIGTATAETPVLEERLEGGIYVGSQLSGDPDSGQMFRVFVHLESKRSGIDVRLPGEVRADPITGRLETTFDNTPQLPASKISLRFKSGPRSPLAMPPTCGTKTTTAELTSWAGHVLERSDSFQVPCRGDAGFSPSFMAGATSPVGGAFSPLTVRIARPDGQQFLSGVRVYLPRGLLGRLRGVPQCGSAAAANGGCPAGSRVGTATVGAGPGSAPFFLDGPVYLTEGYKGAPYGLAVHVQAKAGPYDLGWVRVRQALHIDPETAAVSVVSDPLPQIVKGVPIRLRDVRVAVDRPDFTVNPTSCAEKRVDATLTSIDGAVHRTGSRFQVGDCSALGFKPRLGMRLVGKRQMRSGGHPALRAQLTQGSGQANVRAAKVTLPSNVVLDSRNSVDPKLLCGYDASLKADCPASSIIGRASLRTPLLNRPLSGPVHFVQGIRFENGNRIRTLPTLLVKLRGEVSINLRSKTSTDSKDRLVSIFPSVPDARAGRFNLQIDGGRKGILVVTENRRGRINLCNKRQTALVETDGHNGKRADYPVRVKTPCAKSTSRKRASKRRG